MRENKVGAIVIKCFALLVVLGTAYQAMAQDATTAYPKMAPIEQYLMRSNCRDRPGAQCGTGVHLTRCRGPGSRTSWFRNGSQRQKRFRVYRGAWMVIRSGSRLLESESAGSHMYEFTSRAYVPSSITKITDLALAGRNAGSGERGHRRLLIAKKELPPMEPGAMCYMTAKQGYGGDVVPHWPSHLMFFYSDTDPAIWGANLPGSPVIGLADPCRT